MICSEISYLSTSESMNLCKYTYLCETDTFLCIKYMLCRNESLMKKEVFFF